MSCTVEDDLTAYLDGELSVVEAARVRTHLSSCAECRATETLLRRTLTELTALPTFEPSVGLRRRVLSEVEALPRPWWERLGSWFRPALLAPVAGVALAGAVALVATGYLGARNNPIARGAELAVAENYDLLNDYEVVGLSPEDLEVVEHLDQLKEGRP
jgi:anti-sigma factor RsiW